MSNKDWKRLHADAYDGSNTGISSSIAAEVCEFNSNDDDDDDDDDVLTSSTSKSSL